MFISPKTMENKQDSEILRSRIVYSSDENNDHILLDSISNFSLEQSQIQEHNFVRMENLKKLEQEVNNKLNQINKRLLAIEETEVTFVRKPKNRRENNCEKFQRKKRKETSYCMDIQNLPTNVMDIENLWHENESEHIGLEFDEKLPKIKEQQAVFEKNSQESIRKYEKMQKEINILKQKIEEEIRNKATQRQITFERKLEQLTQKIQLKFVAFQKFRKNLDFQLKTNFLTPLNTPFLSEFRIADNLAIYQGSNEKSTQLLMNRIIPQDRVYRLRCKPLNSNSVMIGITDSRKELKSRSSFDSGNSFCYFAQNGRIFYGVNGFYQFTTKSLELFYGEVITMEVNLKKKSICWYSDDRTKGIVDIYLKEQCEYVPYFQFEQYGDGIKWIQE